MGHAELNDTCSFLQRVYKTLEQVMRGSESLSHKFECNVSCKTQSSMEEKEKRGHLYSMEIYEGL